MTNSSYPISSMLKLIRKAVAPYPKATLFELYNRGYRTLFQQLIACLISVRTYDEVSLQVGVTQSH